MKRKLLYLIDKNSACDSKLNSLYNDLFNKPEFPPRKATWLENRCLDMALWSTNKQLPAWIIAAIQAKGKTYYNDYKKLFNFVRSSEPDDCYGYLYKNKDTIIHQILGKRIAPRCFMQLYLDWTKDCESCAEGLRFVYEMPIAFTFYYAAWFYIPFFKWEMIKLWIRNIK